MEYKHSIIKHKEDASDAPDPISRTMSAQSYGSDMTMRDAHSGPTMVPANLAPAQQSFVEGGVSTTVGGPAPLAGSMQEVDSSRRTATTATAIYGSASDFAGSTGPTTLYPAPWQHNTAAQTTAPGMYSYTQPTHPSHVYPTQEQTSSLQSQSYMGLSYDGLPGPHTLNNSVGQSPGGPPEGYSSYLSPPGRFLPINDLRDPKDGPQ